MNVLGDGLHIVLQCGYNICEDWMAFACWYSISKMLPDAKVSVSCNIVLHNRQFFRWTGRCGVLAGHPKGDFLPIDCGTLMLRELKEEHITYLLHRKVANQLPVEIFCHASDDKFVPFVSCRGNWSNFVESKWINRLERPFPYADKFMKHSSNTNEIKILKLWKQIDSLYTSVSR